MPFCVLRIPTVGGLLVDCYETTSGREKLKRSGIRGGLRFIRRSHDKTGGTRARLGSTPS